MADCNEDNRKRPHIETLDPEALHVVFHGLFILRGAVTISRIFSRKGTEARPQAAPAWGDLLDFTIEVSWPESQTHLHGLPVGIAALAISHSNAVPAGLGVSSYLKLFVASKKVNRASFTTKFHH